VSATFWITRLDEHPILGCPNLPQLPEQLVASKSLRTLMRNTNGRMYEDNNCALRCVALHQLSQLNPAATELNAGFEACVKQLLHDYCLKAQIRPGHFNGVSLDKMDLLEDVAKADINIFKFTMPGDEPPEEPQPVGPDMNAAEDRLFDAVAREGREDTPPPDFMDRLLEEYANRPDGFAGETFVAANAQYVPNEDGDFPADHPDYVNEDIGEQINDEEEIEQPNFEIVSI